MRKTSAIVSLLTTTVLALSAGTAPAALARVAYLAPDTTCNAPIGAVTVPGKLVVPAGATCTLTGTSILGAVEVGIGSTLLAADIDVAGGVLSDRHRFVSITAGTVIQGQSKLFKGGGVTIADSSVFGGLDVYDNTVRPDIRRVGSGNAGVLVTKNQGGALVWNTEANGGLTVSLNFGGPTSVASNRAGDGIKIESNSGGVSVVSNTALDNLDIGKNLGGTEISNNVSHDNINCVDNVPAPTGGGNVGGADGNGAKTGQCAAL
ncbi:hypothetical protein [Rhizohabitans arisaemae]|uniref:hypothetical protein n=1 Tax=Rhizohabitans arisaemae TaxID=2720610 RepID=UPI0024B1F581|nr:hypothetical protein [Rhizohabitans arisaemae]